MSTRPQNHVTRELEARLAPTTFAPLPEIPEALLKALEARYPPRCLQPRETVEDHLRYAGKVDLIAALRAEAGELLDPAVGAEDLDDTDRILRDGERV